MIREHGKYYLYRHIRLDKNEPFYIGIGTKSSEAYPFARAKESFSKNNLWKKIVQKTKYKVDIILESDDDAFIQEKEREFIKMYGRLCTNDGGILANIESGGRQGCSNPNLSKKVYCCNNRTWYDSMQEAAVAIGLNRASVARVVSREFLDVKGYVFRLDGDCECNIDSSWKPLLNEIFNYYINEQKQVKRIDKVLDVNGKLIAKRERDIKPVVRQNGAVQITISFHNDRFNINLKKEYKELFNKEW